MKVRTLGFTFDKNQLPEAMTCTSVFDHMAANPGEKIGTSFQFGAAKVALPLGGKTFDWLAGMLIRIRDSQAYLKLTEKGGKSVLTAENLNEGERLAEISFFLVHPETGNGLLTHHYHSTSIFSFGRICSRIFTTQRRQLRAAALNEAASITAEQKAIRKRYDGKLMLGQLCLDSDLKKLVEDLERVNSFDFSFTTVRNKDRLFRGIAARAKSERIRFVFPPDADVDALAEEVEAAAKAADIDELQVKGVDKHGRQQVYHLNKNPQIFADYDYDQMMKGLNIDLADWAGSIKNSGAIANLGKVASGHSVFQLLAKA